MASDQEREHALQALRSKLIESREWESKLKALRLEIKGLEKDFNQTEENIKALQSVGQIIGEVLKQLDEERCTNPRRRFLRTRNLLFGYLPSVEDNVLTIGNDLQSS